VDTLKNKAYANFDYLSRYTSVPYYYDTTSGREVFGIGTNLKKTTEFVTHKVASNDTLHSLSLKYYNNPTFWWVIAYFNDVQDSFKPLRNKYKTLKIPNISSIEFGRVNA
jgi:nucleoid-associated protein YgaU